MAKNKNKSINAKKGVENKGNANTGGNGGNGKAAAEKPVEKKSVEKVVMEKPVEKSAADGGKKKGAADEGVKQTAAGKAKAAKAAETKATPPKEDAKKKPTGTSGGQAPGGQKKLGQKKSGLKKRSYRQEDYPGFAPSWLQLLILCVVFTIIGFHGGLELNLYCQANDVTPMVAASHFGEYMVEGGKNSSKFLYKNIREVRLPNSFEEAYEQTSGSVVKVTDNVTDFIISGELHEKVSSFSGRAYDKVCFSSKMAKLLVWWLLPEGVGANIDEHLLNFNEAYGKMWWQQATRIMQLLTELVQFYITVWAEMFELLWSNYLQPFWFETVVPFWLETVVPFWSETAKPGLENFVEKHGKPSLQLFTEFSTDMYTVWLEDVYTVWLEAHVVKAKDFTLDIYARHLVDHVEHAKVMAKDAKDLTLETMDKLMDFELIPGVEALEVHLGELEKQDDGEGGASSKSDDEAGKPDCVQTYNPEEDEVPKCEVDLSWFEGPKFLGGGPTSSTAVPPVNNGTHYTTTNSTNSTNTTNSTTSTDGPKIINVGDNVPMEELLRMFAEKQEGEDGGTKDAAFAEMMKMFNDTDYQTSAESGKYYKNTRNGTQEEASSTTKSTSTNSTQFGTASTFEGVHANFGERYAAADANNSITTESSTKCTNDCTFEEFFYLDDSSEGARLDASGVDPNVLAGVLSAKFGRNGENENNRDLNQNSNRIYLADLLAAIRETSELQNAAEQLQKNPVEKAQDLQQLRRQVWRLEQEVEALRSSAGGLEEEGDEDEEDFFHLLSAASNTARAAKGKAESARTQAAKAAAAAANVAAENSDDSSNDSNPSKKDSDSHDDDDIDAFPEDSFAKRFRRSTRWSPESVHSHHGPGMPSMSDLFPPIGERMFGQHRNGRGGRVSAEKKGADAGESSSEDKIPEYARKLNPTEFLQKLPQDVRINEEGKEGRLSWSDQFSQL